MSKTLSASLQAVFDAVVNSASAVGGIASASLHAYLDGETVLAVQDTMAAACELTGLASVAQYKSQFARICALPMDEVRAIVEAFDAGEWVGFASIIKQLRVPSVSGAGRKAKAPGTVVVPAVITAGATEEHAFGMTDVLARLTALRAEVPRCTADMAFMAHMDDTIAMARMIVKAAADKAAK